MSVLASDWLAAVKLRTSTYYRWPESEPCRAAARQDLIHEPWHNFRNVSELNCKEDELASLFDEAERQMKQD
ncbi:hypothetical protein CFAM422_004662 [Trichoderma lentiforme]|uniref:Uncharacterized protein n=1 Tax=Trichoderma lentiforme TaxID=1567552 RepID=A0A9P5CCN2_9HYPO|nr:hypothetical protein CFAM422_004662 [Trichoderma lentiforme]